MTTQDYNDQDVWAKGGKPTNRSTPVGDMPAGLPDIAAKATGDDSLTLPKPDIEKYVSKEKDILERERGAYSRAQGNENKLLGQINRLGQEEVHRERATADSMKPWNAQAELEKFHTNPVQAFGSLGSVFGILASAFTRAPMENALNASAAAINAINEGDQKGYEAAFKSWQENNNLAIKRADMELTAYKTAADLMKTNMEAGRNRLRTELARFGDETKLALLDAGMDDKVLSYVTSFDKAKAELETNKENMNQLAARNMVFSRFGGNIKNPNDPKNAQAWLKMTELLGAPGQTMTEERGLLASYATTPKEDGTFPTSQEIEDRAVKIHQKFQRPMTTEQSIIQNLYDQHTQDGLPPPTSEEISDAVANYRQKATGASAKQAETERHNRAVEEINSKKGDTSEERAKETERHNKAMESLSEKKGGATSLTIQRQNAAAANKYAEELREKNPNMPEDEIAEKRAEKYSELDRKSQHITANRSDELLGKEQQADNIIATSNKVVDFLDHFKGGAGIMGKIMRGEEIAENITGAGTQSDREQFRRDVLKLQLIVPQILTDRVGRPIASQQEKVDGIVAGLEAGDTSPNVIRAYRELIEDIKKRKGDYRKRRGASVDSDNDPAEKKKPSWMDAPVVNNAD